MLQLSGENTLTYMFGMGQKQDGLTVYIGCGLFTMDTLFYVFFISAFLHVCHILIPLYTIVWNVPFLLFLPHFSFQAAVNANFFLEINEVSIESNLCDFTKGSVLENYLDT